jgi:hypothetical protein
MKPFGLFVTVAAMAAIGIVDLSAQGKSGSAPGAGAINAGGGKAVSVRPDVPKARGPQTGVQHGTPAAPATAVHGNPPVATTGATTTVSSGNTTAVKAHGAAAASANGNGKGKPAAPMTAVTTTATTPTSTPVVTANAISTKISAKPQQLARIKTLLPAGMTIEQASAGFRNQAQFIAALNAAKSQHVDFAKLQTAMTVDGLSLGQAVKQLRNAVATTTTTTPPPTTTTPAS